MAAKSVKIKRIKFHYEGFNEARKDPALVADMERRAGSIVDAAEANGGGEYFVEVAESNSRARVIVGTADIEAMHAEATERALTNALDAGRD